MPAGLIESIGGLMRARGIKRHSPDGLRYYSGYFGDLFDWELFFDAVCLPYFGLEELARNGLRLFLEAVREDGFLPRHLRMNPPENDPWGAFEDEEHCKPFLCQTASILSRLDDAPVGEADLLKLARYLDFWLIDLDRDGNGLSEWNSAPHSGADTQFTRVGPWRSGFCEGVDLNCYLYRECLAAAELAAKAFLPKMAAHYAEHARLKKARIQELLWDGGEGFYYDRDIRTGGRIRVKSGAGFIPLWAGVADEEQSAELVRRHLTNPSEFWTPWPVSSYARTEADYTQRYMPPAEADPAFLEEGHANWCGGMWPHWNYLIAHGLADYGFDGEASRLAERFYAAVAADPDLHEWYDAETGRGHGMHPFCAGATVLGAILPLELKLRVNPTAAGNQVNRADIASVRRALGIDRPVVEPDFGID